MDVSRLHNEDVSIPSLQTLRALDAAARLGSYTAAAEALGLTHGAVSHRLRALEGNLGFALFVRRGNGMVATPEAQRLLVPVREALDLLAVAFPPAGGAQTVLRVSMLPSFASRWLTPRLGAFRAAHPDIDLRLDARLDIAPLGPGGVDCAIRYGTGDWPGARGERLAGERLFAVCAPSYRDQLGLVAPADLSRATFLHHDRQLWLPWLRAAGLDWTEPCAGPVFSDTALLLDAALAGQGVALARARLVEGDLASGRLARLFETEVKDRNAYYLVRAANQRQHARATTHFVEWLAGLLNDDTG